MACVAWRFCRAEAHERRSRELGTKATIANGVKLREKNGKAYLKSGELTTKICGKLQWLFIYSFFSVYNIIPCIFLVYTPLKVHGRPCLQNVKLGSSSDATLLRLLHPFINLLSSSLNLNKSNMSRKLRFVSRHR